MRRGVSKRACSVVALLLLLSASLGQAQMTEEPPAPPALAPLQCILDTVATLDVRTSTPRRRPRRTQTNTVHLEARRVLFEPITTSLGRVRTLEGTPTVTGDTRSPWTMYVALPFERSGVTVSAGAEVRSFAVRQDALVANVDLGEGVLMHSARIPCTGLTLTRTPSAVPAVPAAPSLAPSQVRRHARSQTLSLRARPEQGIEAVRLRVPRTLVWEELERREPFVRVRAALPYGGVDGWAYGTDLVE